MDEMFIAMPPTAAEVYLEHVTMRLEKRPWMKFEDADAEAFSVARMYLHLQQLHATKPKPVTNTRGKVVPFKPK